ncbi:methyltransferase [Nocardia cyriacigeorgica]|uniref:Class I SAM-dependent methyltransferase n=1 Tax=Nocardia cyriacigeorgica TaxID=135487 RepID=A0A5R8NR94_9NOCA|nr:class I SAM-dependent methyltransferase [Nocardia cyriacigeorgica]TLF78212.1 class I SAM-dependent methyltransferase [Nocardia cyriacigeorgica]
MAMVQWIEDGSARSARWHSESDAPAPARVVVVDDRTTAKSAYRMARNGMGLLWRGDFHNARQLLRAVDRLQSSRSGPIGDGAAELFHRHRAKRTERARVLGRLMVLLEPDHSLLLRRAPDVRAACDHAYGAADESTCVSLTELLGVIGAYQWHQRGVEIEALGARIHPAYGVFSPVRGEYIDLVAEMPFSPGGTPAKVFDLGTGTGVLAAVLARRGARHVVGTDINPRAVDCASANMRRLGFADRVHIIEADLWPSGRADLVVCNPPWLPAQPSSDLELGIYDPDSDVLHRFLDGLAAHLTPAGEGWLVLSDLAEHLGLRTRDALPARIAAAGLRVVSRHDTQPRHARATDAADPLHEARRREVTSLWRLVRDEAASAARGWR